MLSFGEWVLEDGERRTKLEASMHQKIALLEKELNDAHLKLAELGVADQGQSQAAPLTLSERIELLGTRCSKAEAQVNNLTAKYGATKISSTAKLAAAEKVVEQLRGYVEGAGRLFSCGCTKGLRGVLQEYDAQKDSK